MPGVEVVGVSVVNNGEMTATGTMLVRMRSSVLVMVCGARDGEGCHGDECEGCFFHRVITFQNFGRQSGL